MLLFRTFAYVQGAKPRQSGHPGNLHKPQGRHRLDNPAHYDVWYLADNASGAVGETFGALATWRPAMFAVPAVPGSVRALGIYELPDDMPLLDLDSGPNLADRRLRPTGVVTRVRPVTQAWALRIHQKRDSAGPPLWAGVRWWSWHRPTWPIVGVWGVVPRNARVEPLDIDSPAVVDAARALTRPLRRT